MAKRGNGKGEGGELKGSPPSACAAIADLPTDVGPVVEGAVTGGPSARSDEHVQRLETELRIAKERLQSANEELEASKDGTARAEAALLTSERRFSETQRLAGIGVWDWNLETDEAWWSAGVYQLWGLRPGEPPPPVQDRRFHGADREVYEAAWREARATGELNVEWRVTAPDGSIRWLAEIGRLQRSEGGRRMLGVTRDVTERKQTETRQTLLLGELQHRVRSILGVVRSIVTRTVRSSSSLEELSVHLNGRLDTLARTQGIFTRTGAGSVELEEIVREELVSVAARDEQLTIDGPSVRLRRQAAETFALALHELITNAVKYGALSEPTGRLSVIWRVVNTSQGPRLSLDWRESGVRALAISPVRWGFGRELLERGLPHELAATTSLEFRQGGLHALIELPFTDRIAETPPDPQAQAG